MIALILGRPLPLESINYGPFRRTDVYYHSRKQMKEGTATLRGERLGRRMDRDLNSRIELQRRRKNETGMFLA